MSGFFRQLVRVAAVTAGTMSGNPYLIAVGLGVSTAVGMYDARRARKAIDDNKKQRDLSLTLPTTPRRRIYGTAKVEGALRYWVTHGDEQRFVSMVYLLADHKCADILDIQLDDETIGSLDGSGYVQPGSKWYKSQVDLYTQNLAATAGVITLPSATAAMPTVSVRSSLLFPNAIPLPEGYTEIVAGVDFTHTVGSTTITLAGDLAGDTLGADDIVVNWQTQAGRPLVRIRKYLGAALPQTADATLITDSGGEWGSTARLDGQTYVILTREWDQTIGAGDAPVLSAIVKGAEVYDPRTTTTAWSDNWALCVADAIKTMSGSGNADIVAADWTDSANRSDELVAVAAAKSITGITKAAQGVVSCPGHGLLAGDTLEFSVAGMTQLNGHLVTIASIVDASTFVIAENTSSYGTFTSGTVTPKVKRYTLNGYYETTDDPLDVLADMEIAGGGTIVWTAGQWRVLCGAYRTPVSISLTDADLISGIEYRAKPTGQDRFNSVNGTFFDARVVGGTSLHTRTSYTAYTSAAYVAEDNGEEYERTINFRFVTDYRVCHRLAKQHMHRARQGAVFTGRWTLKALPLQVGDLVPVTVARYGLSAKVFEVIKAAHIFPNQVELTLQETAAEVFDWAYTEAAFLDPAPNTMLRSPTDVSRPILSVVCTADDPATIKTLADGSQIPYARVSWPARTNAAEYVSLRWKRSFETAYRTLDARPGETFIDIDGVSGGDVLQILGYAINSINARSDPWVIQEFHVDSRLPRFNGVIPALSANLLKNATLEVNGQAWSTFEIGISPGVSSFGKWDDDAGIVPGVPSSCVLVTTASQTGNGYVGAVQSSAFSVDPSKRYAAYAGLIGYATDAYVAILWLDEDGAQCGLSPGNVVAGNTTSAAGYWNLPASYTVSSVVVDAPPAAAVSARVIVYATGNWGSAPAKAVSVFQPFVGELPVGAVDLPVWQPGGSNVVDGTTIAPGATRRVDLGLALLSGYVASVPKDQARAIGNPAVIQGTFDGTGQRVLVTVTGDCEQLSDGSGDPIECTGYIECVGASTLVSPARLLLYLASTPATPDPQITHKAGFEVTAQFTLPAPQPAGPNRYAFTFYVSSPAGTVESLILFRNVTINFDIAR